MKKPRPYSGPVDFLDQAHDRAGEWTDATLTAVMGAFPYPPERHVRMSDWVELVSHVSHHRGEDVTGCAERLALYATAYAESHGLAPRPAVIERTQT